MWSKGDTCAAWCHSAGSKKHRRVAFTCRWLKCGDITLSSPESTRGTLPQYNTCHSHVHQSFCLSFSFQTLFSYRLFLFYYYLWKIKCNLVGGPRLHHDPVLGTMWRVWIIVCNINLNKYVINLVLIKKKVYYNVIYVWIFFI